VLVGVKGVRVVADAAADGKLVPALLEAVTLQV
jgi:hypothetical protein